MNDLRTAAQQALEAWDGGDTEWFKRAYTVVEALRAALAEPVQEPVAWRTFDGEGGYDYTTYDDDTADYAEKWNARNPNHKGWVDPLYPAPPQRKPLTDEELDDIAVAARRGNLYDLRIAIERAHEIGGNDE